jgi:hypothetical protein
MKAHIEIPTSNLDKFSKLINPKISIEHENWYSSLQQCYITDTELDKVIKYFGYEYPFSNNTIEVTDIIEAYKSCCGQCDGIEDECNGREMYRFKSIEDIDLKYTTQEIIDAVNYGFKYATESQNHTGDVPIGNILQWIMYKRNLLNVPKEFEILKKTKKIK